MIREQPEPRDDRSDQDEHHDEHQDEHQDQEREQGRDQGRDENRDADRHVAYRSEAPGASGADRDAWAAADVRRLRGYLGESQAALAARLGARQQTVSEWETGVSRPRRMSRRLLRLVAEESGYYAAGGEAEPGPGPGR